jgi:hypothetical protein
MRRWGGTSELQVSIGEGPGKTVDDVPLMGNVGLGADLFGDGRNWHS